MDLKRIRSGVVSLPLRRVEWFNSAREFLPRGRHLPAVSLARVAGRVQEVAKALNVAVTPAVAI